MNLINRALLPAALLALVVGTALAGDDPVADPGPLPAAQFNISEFKGHVVLVDFWASWCEPCKASLPWLNTMQQKYGAKGLQVIMINLDKNVTAAEKMSGDIDDGIRQFLDPEGELATRFELEGMPSTFLYDRSGKLISSHVGFLKADGLKREQGIVTALEKEEH